MVLTEHSEFIQAPCDRVFALFFDFERRQTLSGVTSLRIVENARPLGTTYAEARCMNGRDIPAQTFTVVDYLENQRFAVETQASGVPLTISYDFFSDADTTEVRVTFEAQFKGFLGRILGLFRGRLAAPIRGVLEKELTEYKVMAEQSDPSSA